MRYVFYRLWRLSGSPHAIAVGCAAGVFIGFTPLYGFQFVLAALLAWVLGGSIVAAALGTFVANPISFPVIWYSTYKLGCVMLTGNVLGSCGTLPEGLAGWGSAVFERLMDFSMEAALLVFEGIWPVIKPMALGSLPIGALAASVSYIAVRQMVELRQRRRRERIGARSGTSLADTLGLPSGSSTQSV
ncbi:DUF2062 domain-containing protein [Dichotomicrobium thermohalophilum]|uniref:DUF2062 domain-containing protein n=1 Tax=Dichotomicrobium thermohalophilum TaxID=933063 RepID=UPI001475FC81|nr:DUF2062 domain-containing protein [Dichotomicrobium thermohalophilum]